uniref:Uncharacterized protein n=1 Tax=Panagrolaimus sp. ES5 TaxID=591445 RepID=A0AC34FGP2_9BILA
MIFNTVIIFIWQCSRSTQPTKNNKNGTTKNGKKGKERSAFSSTISGSSPARTTLSSVQTKISSQEGKNNNHHNLQHLNAGGAGGKKIETTKLIVQSNHVLKEQPTQTIRSNKAAATGILKNKNKNNNNQSKDGVKVIGAIKNTKPKNPKHLSRKSNNKSLMLQSTQFSIRSGKQEKLKGTQSDDELHDKRGTPELTTDRTQKSYSHRLADDEGTNSNIEELPMDKHKSE